MNDRQKKNSFDSSRQWLLTGSQTRGISLLITVSVNKKDEKPSVFLEIIQKHKLKKETLKNKQIPCWKFPNHNPKRKLVKFTIPFSNT